jgi:hypothetical protein
VFERVEEAKQLDTPINLTVGRARAAEVRPNLNSGLGKKLSAQ